MAAQFLHFSRTGSSYLSSADPVVDILDLVVDGANGFVPVADGVVGQVDNAKRQLPQPADGKYLSLTYSSDAACFVVGQSRLIILNPTDSVDDLTYDVGDAGIAVGSALDDALGVQKRDDEAADLLDSIGAGADELVEVVGSVTQNAGNTS